MNPLLSLFGICLFLCSQLLSVAIAEPLDAELDKYLQLTNEQPAQASAFIRSLEAQLTPSTPAIARARLWSYLGSDYREHRDFAKAQHYIDLNLELAEKSQSEDIRTEALTDQLALHLAQNQPGKARALVSQLQEALSGANLERVRYYAANTLGSFLQSEDRYEDALQAYYQAFHAIENSSHPRTAVRRIYLQGAIAGLNTVLAQYQKADELLQTAIKQAQSDAGLNFMLPDLYLQLGVNYASQQQNSSAEQANQQGLQWARRLNNKLSIATLLNNLGDLRLKQGQYAEAVQLFTESRQLAEQLNYSAMVLTAEFNLGYIQVLQGKQQEGLAQMAAMVAKARELQLADTELLSYVGELADAYGIAKAHADEARLLREYNVLSQNIFKTDRDQEISALQEAFSAKEKAKQIESLEQQNKLNTAELAQKQLQQRVMLLFGLVVLLATALLYLLYRKVRNANLQLRQANDQLAYNSLHDPLTGLLNRRSLHEFMQKRTEQGERRQLPTAATDGFILLDIDYFKHINDHHGHAAGDAVLVEIGQRLKQLTRQGDMVLRWGGEEFLIVLRNLNQTALTNFTNRALQVIGSTPVPYQNSSIPVTASAGFLTLPFAGVDETQLNWEKALKLADMALYMGKVHGRNRGYGLVALHRPYEELKAQLETDLSLPIEQGHLEITLVLGPPQS
ncbi:tetratricopeptide repeat-containing diguanylate cyclase [Rheinheimera texasensis]|uniref:tetratricopeptide repeat-containing diguanylate cyclase n=1 Tax=Rheinheimera texasensis TaxID=306205 RepID=UPI00068CE450|nr:diguanylate cyclase [Rheinheimera texasensis]